MADITDVTRGNSTTEKTSQVKIVVTEASQEDEHYQDAPENMASPDISLDKSYDAAGSFAEADTSLQVTRNSF